MRRTILTALTLALCACARQYGGKDEPVIPAFLVGEWATDGAEFSGDLLTKGGALYLYANGDAVVIGGSPAVGMPGNATFVTDSSRLNVRLMQRGRIRGNIYLRYDAQQKTLLTAGALRQTEGSYTRRKPRAPESIARLLEDR